MLKYLCSFLKGPAVEEEEEEKAGKKKKKNKKKDKEKEKQKEKQKKEKKKEKRKEKEKAKEKKKKKDKKKREPVRISADPNVQNADGDTPLHLIARRGNFEEIVALLVHPTIDIFVKNNDGELPLSGIPDFEIFEKKVLSFFFFSFLFFLLSPLSLFSSLLFFFLFFNFK